MCVCVCVGVCVCGGGVCGLCQESRAWRVHLAFWGLFCGLVSILGIVYDCMIGVSVGTMGLFGLFVEGERGTYRLCPE